MFQVSVNSNVLYISPRFFAFHICTVVIKNIKNIYTVSTNQIADTLHYNDNDFNVKFGQNISEYTSTVIMIP